MGAATKWRQVGRPTARRENCAADEKTTTRRDAALPPYATSYGLIYSCIIRVRIRTYMYSYTRIRYTLVRIRTYLQLDSSFQQYLYQIDVLLLDGDDERASV